MKYSEKYYKTFERTRLFSKIASFLITILVFAEIIILPLTLSKAAQTVLDDLKNEILVSFSFLILIAFIFSLRFIFLWFKSFKYLLFAQISWLLGWLSIYAYKLVSAKFFFGSFWAGRGSDCIDCFYSQTFLFASNSLVIILLAYLIISPIKQLSTFIYSLFLKE